MDESLEFVAKLFGHSMDLTHQMTNSAIECFQKRAEEAEKLCDIYLDYIQYVNTCIKLQVIPRSFSYWKEYIL